MATTKDKLILNIGDVFVLKPKARIKWLVFGRYKNGPIQAVRCDSQVGKALLEWIAAGSPVDKTPCSARFVLNSPTATEFYEHDLTTAEVKP